MSPIDLLDDTNRPTSSESETSKMVSKLNGIEPETRNGMSQDEISSDETEINSINQDTTPTATPNESNTKAEEKFSEFSLPKNLPPPHPPPPPQLPNSLPLKTNLNSTCNKQNILHHSYTTQPIYNTSPMSSYPTLMYQSMPNTPQLHSPMYNPQLINYINKNDILNSKVTNNNNNPSTVFVHVDAGNIFQVQLGDKVRDILGPATVKIVNNDSTQPVPLQLTAPAPGQIVQQIVDENGMLVHLIISSQQQQQPNQMMHLNGAGNHRQDIPNGLNNQQQGYSKQNYSCNQHGYAFPNDQAFNSYQGQYNTGAYLQPISVESNQEFKESDLDSETSLASQSKSEGDESLNNTSSNTPGLSSTSTLSISPLSSSSCSSASASNSASSSSSSSNCSTSSTTYKPDDSINTTPYQTDSFKRKNNQNLRLAQNTSNLILNTNNQAINSTNNNSTLNRSKENKVFVNSNKKQPINGTINQSVNNPSNKTHQNFTSYNNHLVQQQQFMYTNKYPASAGATSRHQMNQTQNKKYLNDDSQVFYPKNFPTHEQQSQKSTLLIENHRLSQEPVDIDVHIEQNLDFLESILERIKKPIVKNIEPQSVFVYLSPIELTKDDLTVTDSNLRPILITDLINKFQNLNYTLEISCETESNFDKVYTGDANEITLKDLKSNTKYYLRVNASLNAKCKSPTTEIVSFQTKPLHPDQPQAPKQTGVKKKNELTLKWTSPCDNGSKINNFILDYQEICSDYQSLDDLESNLGEFTQLYKGPLKQFIVKKLNPSTCYAFRLAAENNHGLSEYSPVSFIFTAGSVPNVPESPKLVESTISSLTLSWGPKRLNEIDYELQMLDSEDKISLSHGFLTIFNGPALAYTVTDLRRKCVYQFRLRAKNEEGSSAWSDVKKFSTLADVPKAAGKIRTKIQGSNTYKFNWESPKDDGGEPIKLYTLEMSEFEQNVFEEIYTGDKNECLIEKCLKPGFCYVLRVLCTNSIGLSPYSELSTFLTTSVPPVKCSAPKLSAKPKSNSAQVKWSAPDEDGGAPILNYELCLQMNLDEEENIVYKGNEFSAILNGLLPGRNYFLKLRAMNKNGAGPWSENFEFTSGAASPDAPDSLFITTKSSNCLLINWTEPACNGSPIIEYRLEWSMKDSEQFTNLFTGNSLKFELKNLFLPNTKYVFRVQAININGPSQFSSLVEYLTPASVPSIVNGIRLEEINTDSAQITWKQPNTNGSPIQFYNIDFGEHTSNFNPYIVLHQNECTYLFDSLQPDTNYKFRIQAANSVGIGQFSNMVKFKTKALAPQAPNLECVSISYNSIKLKWNVGENLIYVLQSKRYEEIQSDTENPDDEFVTIYKGPLAAFKQNKLLESTSYLFRICAVNEAGQGKWSDSYKYTTTKAPPLITRPPTVSDISQNSCLVEWQSAKLPHSASDLADERTDLLEYCLQIQKKDSDYKEVYRGLSCSFRLKDLEANTEYSLRVCAAILKDDTTQQRICSPFSPLGVFSTLKIVKSSAKENKLEAESNSQESAKSWLDKFLLPSFFGSLNSKSKSEPITKASSSSSKQKTAKKSSITKYTINETDLECDSKVMNRRKSDQYWAFLLIFFLVLIAFLIAYCVSFYFELPTVNNSEF